MFGKNVGQLIFSWNEANLKVVHQNFFSAKMNVELDVFYMRMEEWVYCGADIVTPENKVLHL